MPRFCSLCLVFICLVTFWPSFSSATDYNYAFIVSDEVKYLALPASFGPSPPDSGHPLVAHLAQAVPYEACEPLNPIDVRGHIVMVQRGNCSFVSKARTAMQAGAVAMIVVNTKDSASVMSDEGNSNITIPCMMISSSDGGKLLANMSQPVSVYGYNSPRFDMSVVVLFVLAVGTIIGAAFWAAAGERKNAQLRAAHLPIPALSQEEQMREQEQIAYLNETAAMGFVVVASVGLVVLFYFINKLIYVLIGVFVLGGTQGLLACSAALLSMLMPKTAEKTVGVPGLGRVQLLSVLLLPLCLLVCILWAVYRHREYAWIMQDVMSICLLMLLQRTIRLPNIKVSCILLVLAFVYDIFWVFISPYFFSKSVMVEVATGGGTGESIPMLLTIPRFQDELGGRSLLGLGDIALPGLLVSYLLRFDYRKGLHKGFRGYFPIAVIGYAVGLLLTDLALLLMKKGQPALLYLVPCTLGVVCAVAYRQGHLVELWHGDEQTQQSHALLLEEGVNRNSEEMDHDHHHSSHTPLVLTQNGRSQPV